MSIPQRSLVSVVARNPNQLDLFVVGNDGGIYSTWWNPTDGWESNHNWFRIGQPEHNVPRNSVVSVVARNPDQLDLFVVGNDGGIYSTWWNPNDGWDLNHNWFRIGQPEHNVPRNSVVSVVARNPDQLDLFVVGNDGGIYSTWWNPNDGWDLNHNWFSIDLIGTNYTFDAAITLAQVNTLLERHRFGYSRSKVCANLSDPEKQSLRQAYFRAIQHGLETRNGVNASATIGGSHIDVNFGVLFPQGAVEIAQTLIHEMMHCAGFTHPDRRDPPTGMSCRAPNPAIFDCPFDGGQYFGTPPLRAEICIAGNQSDVMMLIRRKAAEDTCIIDASGRASIHSDESASGF
jgi:hypothetical protein